MGKKTEKQLMNGVGALSAPSKMPGHSFSLPAGDACPASKLTLKTHGENATCAFCYAKSGFYRMPNVAAAQQARFQFVRDSLKNNRGDEFVAVMVEEIVRVTQRGERIFRIHDSGDFFSEGYIRAWIRICKALPDVLFWAPTREHLRPKPLALLRELAALPNVAIRPSSPGNNLPAPVVDGLHAGSTVYLRAEDVPEGHYICPSTNSDDHTCNGHKCRTCWVAKDTPVVYLAHGPQAKKSRRLAVLDAVA